MVKDVSFDMFWWKLWDKCEIEDLYFYDLRYEVCIRFVRKFEVLDLVRMIGYNDLWSLMVYYNVIVLEIVNRLD